MLAADLSSHNTVTSWPALLASVDAVIAKVSEGTGYVWPGAATALGQARAAGKCVGAYHFYGGGNAVAEADYFLAHYAHQPGEVIVLDWEPASPPADPDGTAAVFCARIAAATGVAPLVYMSGSTARSQTWTRTRAASRGLWVASYGANTGSPGTPPTVGAWGSWLGWQYTPLGARPGLSGPVDLSTFTGTASDWRAYGTPGSSLMALSDAQQQQLYDWLGQLVTVIGDAYDGPGDDLGSKVKALAVELAPVERLAADGKTVVKVPLRQEIADTKTAVLALTQQVTDVEAKLAALPATAAPMACQGNPHAVLAAISQAAGAAAANTA